jgi:flavin-binding protein dodecin
MSVYRVTEIIGSSEHGWAEAAEEALSAARASLRDLRVVEVVNQDVALGDDGKIAAYRVKLRVSFKLEQHAAEEALVRDVLGF